MSVRNGPQDRTRTLVRGHRLRSSHNLAATVKKSQVTPSKTPATSCGPKLKPMTKKSTSKKSQTAKSTSDETTTRTNAGKGRGFVADDAGDTRGRRERAATHAVRIVGWGRCRWCLRAATRPPGGRHRGGRRHRRGDVRSALLLLISESPRHGYELMQAIGERTEGRGR